jgi:radical SAM protein with 4Fe4S-binding SPASM domain
MEVPLRVRSLWAERAFLWHTAEKFRIKPLLAHMTRRLSPRCPWEAPPTVILQLTEACNLRCRMCYEWGETGHQHLEGQGKPATLALGTVESLMEDCRKEKTFYSLFGGEPLLYPGVEKVLERAKRYGSSIETVTNGTLLAQKARMLIELGLDLVRISIDGPREVNDLQRGRGSYDRALQGIEALFEEKQRLRKGNPLVGLIYTVTSDNCLALERLFCHDLNLRWVDVVTLQMQSFVTEGMGRTYGHVLEEQFQQHGNTYWKGMVRELETFSGIDVKEMVRQFKKVRSTLLKRGIFLLLFPNTWTEKNLAMYLQGRWREMNDYKGHCIAPWTVTDITARGDVAPCHIFYDLTLGNLHSHSIREVWNGEAFNRFRDYMRRHLLPVCPACCQFYGYP